MPVATLSGIGLTYGFRFQFDIRIRSGLDCGSLFVLTSLDWSYLSGLWGLFLGKCRGLSCGKVRCRER